MMRKTVPNSTITNIPMLGYSISLIFRGLSIYRWNNFPRIEAVSATDHIGFILHISLTLAHILEEKEGKKTDLGYIYRKILFSSFPTFIHSDISSDVKQRIRLKNPLVARELENKAYDILLGWELPPWMKEDVESIRNEIFIREEPYPLENAIIRYSKLWASYHEAYFSNEVHLDVYKPAMALIRKNMAAPEFSTFRQYLDSNPQNQTPIENYLLNVRRLQSNFRWNRMRRMYPVSVMSHLFVIFFLSYVIGHVEGKSRDEITDMMTTALFHDIPEVITGDVIAPTKKSIAGLEELLAEIEDEMVHEYLLTYLNEYSFKEKFEKAMLDPWNQPNGKLVKLADIFSALFEAKIEVGNNPEFLKIYARLKKHLHETERKSVDYIFKFGVDYFEDSLEDVMR